MKMFRMYDIRGVVGEDLTDDMVERIGKAVGTYIQGKVVVCRDNRIHSKKIRDIFVKALLSTGCDVIDIGEEPTPVLYFSAMHYKANGGIAITASHNPKEYNGFKLIKNGAMLSGDEIQEVGKMAHKGEFAAGEGKLEEKNIKEEYIKNILSKIKLKSELKVGVDCGNGTASSLYPEVLEKIGCKLTRLYCTSDGNFPNHEPDPVVEDNIKDLIKTVKEQKLDLGIGFDGDGDRIGVVDSEGNIVAGDKILILLSRELLKTEPGSKILFDVKCSMLLPQDIEKHNGVPVMYKTGHSLIKAKMKEDDVTLAGEMSGHIFFKELNFFDDALYAACKLLQIVSSGKSLVEMLSDLPHTYVTPEIRFHCDDDKKFEVIKKLQQEFAKYNPNTIDGVRIGFDDGWGLVRASNTGPVLVMRFEALSQERLKEIRELIESEVKKWSA
ncbi:MAG: phosphomannomutase/phosphoglucomutase [Candidatus Woesearchaeota archaeon]